VRLARTRRLEPAEVGFLVTSADAGQPAAVTVERALHEENPDTVASPVGDWTSVCEGRAPVSGGRQVHLGGLQGKGAVVFTTSASCQRCAQVSLKALEPTPAGLEDLLGALAALIHQRWALGLPGPAEGILVATDAGAIEAGPLRLCGAHR
jgi:hypothetical protein